MSSFGTTSRHAKSRLSDMVINEVSLVDAAANLRKFVLTKRNDDMNTQKMTLKLPAAAKQAMMDGIGQALDKATALASVVGDAETDDAAAVPEELNTALKQIGEMFNGMAAQYGGSAPATDAGAAQPPPAPASPGEAAPSPDMGKALDATAKGLPSECKDGSNFKQLLNDGDSFKTLLHKAVAAGHLEVAAWEKLDKAGRKIAGARFTKLTELHDTLGKLLNELAYDEAAEAKAGMEAEKAKTPPPPPPKKPAEAAPAAKGAEGTVAKSDGTALESEAVILMKGMKELIEAQGKQILAQGKELAAIGKAHGVTNAGSVEGEAAPEPSSNVQWASDMSAAVAKKHKANGATGRA